MQSSLHQIGLHLNRVFDKSSPELSSAVIRYVSFYRKTYSMHREILRRPLYRLICYLKRSSGALWRCHRLNTDINDRNVSRIFKARANVSFVWRVSECPGDLSALGYAVLQLFTNVLTSSLVLIMKQRIKRWLIGRLNVFYCEEILLGSYAVLKINSEYVLKYCSAFCFLD